MSYQTEVLADSPVVYWRLSDTSDATGGGRSLTAGSVAPGFVPGLITLDPDDASDFTDATNSYYDASDDAVFDFSGVASYSVEAWINPDTVDGVFRRFVSHEQALTNGYSCTWTTAGGIQFNRTEASSTVQCTTGISTAGVVYHVVGTYDGSNLRCYVNGTLRGGPTADSRSLTAPASTVRIGKRSSSTGAEGYDGKIDEVAIYSTALSQARILAHYQAGQLQFPTTPVLDDFTGSDENPITTGWTTPMHASNSAMRRLSNQLAGTTGGVFNNAWWDATQFGPDVEAFATIATLPSNGQPTSVWARVQNPGTTSMEGYLAVYSGNGADAVYLGKYVGGTWAGNVGPTMQHPLVAGDRIGIRCIGTTIEFWTYESGEWSLLIQVTDTSHQAAGHIGAEIYHTTARLDDFGGGSVVSATPKQTLFLPRVRYVRA